MHVTTSNYQATTAKYGLPEKLRQFHVELIADVMKNNWAAYHADKEVAKTVDMYLDKYGQYIDNMPAKAPAPAKTSKPKVVKPAKVVQPAKAKSVKPAKAKAVKTSKKATASETAKRVPKFPPAIRVVQRFVEMVNKPAKTEDVVRLLKFFQQAILKKEIRKTNRNASELNSIQETLVNVCSKTKSGSVQINVTELQLSKLIGIAGGERVYPSVTILKRYVRYQGKPVTKVLVAKMLADIESAYGNKNQISDRDPLRAKVLEIKKHLTPLMKSGAGPFKVTIGAQQMRGLGAILDNCGSDEVNGLDGLEGEPATSNSAVMTSGELMKISYSTIGLKGKWKRFLGDPAKGFTMMIFGKPGQGKSTFALDMARDMAVSGDKALYISSEEHGSYTLQDKLSRVGGGVPGLSFAAKLGDVSLREYQVLFIDSVQVNGLSLESFRKLKAQYTKLGIVLVMQTTKEGNFKGNQEWGHEVDTIIEVSEGVARTTKNRYAALSALRIW